MKHVRNVGVLVVLVAMGTAGAMAALAAEEAAKSEAAPPAQVAAAPEVAAAKPRIEVVFVLDTTGSMGGLIEAAKQKIWALANTMVTAKPTPEVSLGLVAYRDRGDEYVTKVFPLSRDLDAIHASLMGFSANGGGDGPESVNQALQEAVSKGGWSSDRNVYRVIFLVGDCPPHMDYDDDVKYQETCKVAAKAGIIINTIQCGTHGETTPVWQEIARLAEGQFFQLEQSGNAVVAETPFDKDLARLSHEMDATRLYYGTAADLERQGGRERRAEMLYRDSSITAQAARAVFNAGEGGAANFAGEKELLTDLAGGRVKLDELSTEVLPEAMRKMTAEERAAHVASQQAARQKIQEQIQALSVKRQEHLAKLASESAKPGSATLDESLYKAVREQGKKQADLEYTESAPRY